MEPVQSQGAGRSGWELLHATARLCLCPPPHANLFYIKQMTKAVFSTCCIQVEKKLDKPHIATCAQPARVRCKVQEPSDGQLFRPSEFPTPDCVAEPSNQNLSLRVSLLPTFSLRHIFQLASGTTWVWL